MLRLHTVVMLNDLSFVHSRLGDTMTAGAKIQQLQDQISKTSKPRQRISLQNDLVMELCHSDPAAAMQVAAEALEQANSIHFPIGIARSFFGMAMAQLSQAKYADAYSTFRKALDAYRMAEDRWGESNALNRMGLILQRLGNNSKALDFFADSLRVKEEAEDDYGRAHVLISMAGIYRDGGKAKDAESVIRSALEIAQCIKAPSLAGKALAERGNIRINLLDFSAAAADYGQALELFEAQNDQSGVSHCLLQQGRILLQTGKADAAQAKFQQVMEIALRMGDRSTESMVNMELAQMSATTGDREGESRHLLLALSIAESLGEKPLLAGIHQKLSDLFLAERKFEEALHQMIMARELSGEVNAKETAERLQDLETARKIEWLERENRLTEIEGRLAMEEVRRRISGDLHDEIGAALSGFSIFSNAIRREIEKGNLTEAIHSVECIGEESRELLERLSDIVWAINPRNDRFGQALIRLQNYAVRICTGKEIELNFFADAALQDLLLPLEARNNLYLILKEAVNNAAKYSGAKKLDVLVRKEGHAITATVEDNGKGFETNADSEGNGLRNMKHRAEEVNGLVRIQSGPGSGTRIMVEVPY